MPPVLQTVCFVSSMKMSGVKIVILCCCCIVLVQAKPFLTNAFQNLASSLIPVPSSSDNIEDLRRQKPDKIRELSKYQEDKEELLEEDGNVNGQNEAVPNIFQKKISAVLRKLQLIAEIGRQFIPNNNDNGNGGGELKDPDFDFDFEEDFDGGDNSTETNNLVLKIGDEGETRKDALITSEKTKFFSPGAVGIYLMELVGSVMGLIYGAAIQFVGSSSARE